MATDVAFKLLKIVGERKARSQKRVSRSEKCKKINY